jgi:ABC-2 type transport system permease protein
MKWYRSFAIVKKELWEFRRQKYILYSLLLPPLIFAIVLPSVTFLPIFSQLSNVDQSVVDQYKADPGLPVTNVTLGSSDLAGFLANHTANGTAFISSAYLDNVTILKVNADGCIFDMSYVRDYQINGSVVIGGTIMTGVIKNSLLVNVTVRSSVLINCTGLNVTIWDSSMIRSDQLEVVSEDGMRMLDLIALLLNTYSFMLVLAPVITPTVIASYTFVGEKNNRSLEPLLATPASDSEILWGKILAIFIPTILTTIMGFAIFAVVTNMLFLENLGYAPLPNDVWLFSMIVLAPLICFLSIVANIIISSRMSDVRASQQVGSLVVLPVMVIFIGSFSGAITFGAASILLIGAVMLAVDAVVYLLVKKSFQRENILIRWK